MAMEKMFAFPRVHASVKYTIPDFVHALPKLSDLSRATLTSTFTGGIKEYTSDWYWWETNLKITVTAFSI